MNELTCDMCAVQPLIEKELCTFDQEIESVLYVIQGERMWIWMMNKIDIT